MNSSFSWSARVRSFGFALRGLGFVLRTQHNAWIHLVASVLVVLMAYLLEVSRWDWCWLTLAISGVWAAEAFNSAIERLADAAIPEPHPLIAQAKDAAAGGVLAVVAGSVVIGLLVLGPPLWSRLAELL